jgi:hypothetical protein
MYLVPFDTNTRHALSFHFRSMGVLTVAPMATEPTSQRRKCREYVIITENLGRLGLTTGDSLSYHLHTGSQGRGLFDYVWKHDYWSTLRP